MSDVFGLADVSSKDTGRGSVLKTGGMRRKHNKGKKKMPSKMKCKTGWKAMGYKSMSDCQSYGKKKMTQKPDTSAKDESSKREKDRAIAANSRMKKQLAKQRMSMPGMRKPDGSY
tara:strand:+ start:204 stop:548 length:345 start_codon:yes stop_codon:yes gene_type:complete